MFLDKELLEMCRFVDCSKPENTQSYFKEKAQELKFLVYKHDEEL